MFLVLLAAANEVAAVEVIGARFFKPKEIIAVVGIKKGQPFRLVLLRGGEAKLKALYFSKGFFDVQISDSVVYTDRGVKVFLKIREGSRARLVDIVPVGMESVDSLSLYRFLRKRVPPELPVPYDDSIVAEVEEALYDLYQRSGFPYAEIHSERIEVGRDLFLVKVHVSEGPRIRIRQVLVTGYKSVKPDLITREITVKPGEVYNYKKIAESQRRIYSTGLFSRVDYRLDTTDTLGILTFIVSEAKPRYLDIGAGYHTPFELQAKVALGHYNLWGRGQRGELSAEGFWSTQGFPRRKVEARYSEPWFLGFRLDATALLGYEYDRELASERVYLSGGVSKEITRYWRGSAGLRWSRVVTVGLPLEEPRVVVNAFYQGLNLDSRDNIFDPTKGFYGRLYVEEGGGVLGGDADLYEVYLSLAGYSRLTKGGYLLAYRVVFGDQEPWGRTVNVPYSERYTLGGDGSVRGYTRYSIGRYDPRGIRSGTKLLNLNLELRKHLTRRWGFALFWDMGGLWNLWSQFRDDPPKSSAGFGLRYFTPIGPIRADWARAIGGSGWGMVHLGLGHMF